MSKPKQDNTRFLHHASQLAQKGRKTVGTNPMVGAVFVKDGEVIAQGYHKQFGGFHAEVEAINAAKRNHVSLKGSTLYVTLEPCSHTGKQGPCAEALLETGIERVVYAQQDPNPLVAGKGIKQLNENGIKTDHIAIPATKKLNEIYLKNSLRKQPFVHIKSAATRDGKITLKKGTQSALSNSTSNARVHELRQFHDAILIGINTLLIDDPKLTARNAEGKAHPDSPIRVIVDSQLRTPPSAHIFQETGGIIIATTTTSTQDYGDQTEILVCEKKEGRVDLDDLLNKLFEKGIKSVLVEGGETINTALIREELADRITICLTNKLSQDATAPSIINAQTVMPMNLVDVSLEMVENDLWIDGTINLSQ
jgi:diaminohydroxyphosphoribosylaminopyrimidine deaminase/5-amino-6-(5-phosphoribosylamino)uracil reductase